jgi:hypothetical protein
MHATNIARRPRIARARRFACALAVLAALGTGALDASASPALAGDCANEQLRSENNSTRLPECRAYEMVTPLYKEGFPVERPTYGDDGGAVAYISLGNFADGAQGGFNRYIATRSSAGWTTTSPYGPATTYNSYEIVVFSADLRSSLVLMQRGAAPADEGQFYYLRGPEGSFTRVGPVAVPGVDGGGASTREASPDLTHVIFGHGLGTSNDESAALYEFVGTGNEGPPRPVSVDNAGASTPGEACSAGLTNGDGRDTPGISTDGRVIAFLSGCNGTGALQLWARVGGSATVAVSRSECTRTSGDPGGVCNALAPASYAGMATDGSRVYFTTTQQLVNGDTDQSNDLYDCEILPGAPAPVGLANSCSSLTEVSGNASGANVEGVVRISEDGSRVYFVAKGVLAANLGTNDAAPVAGDENLYVWQKDAAHPAGQATFVTKLESGIGQAQTTTDGRYLVFTTASRLLPSDTDEAADVYRYDADTHGLLRLSTDSSGTGGDEPGADVRLANPGTPTLGTPVRLKSAITSDAATVVFGTAEQLSPADTNNGPDVYAWHDGQVSLISPGGAYGASALGITASGRDIFFETGQPLTAGDSGTEGDVYDARVDGGFPVAAPATCSGEACQGSTTPQPQPPSASASAAFNGPGSPLAAEAPPASQPKPKLQTAAQKLAKALKACKAKHNKKKRKACEKRARNTYRRANR